MSTFEKVASVEDFAVKKSLRVSIGDVQIALFAVGGTYYAVQNDCPHQHYSAMHDGILRHGQITCPMHGWTFDLATGKATIGGGRLRTYAVKVVGSEIHINVPSDDPNWAKQ
jgi:nitrite reductase/ring-hydroxylating ferredoxin subunit